MTERSLELELVGGEDAEPLFATEEEFVEFRSRFEEGIKPELERLDEARRQSEERAKQHLIC